MQNSIATLSLTIGAIALYWLVIVVIEATSMQLLGWGNLRTSLKASLLANLASSIPLIISLIYIQRFGFLIILAGFFVILLIETLVLNRIKPAHVQKLFLITSLINLISFGILILPIYFFVN